MKARALLAWNLRRIRVERGLSQDALADEAGADRAYVGSLERERQNPTIDLLDRLAKVLKADMSEFFAKIPKGAPRPKPLPAGRKAALSSRRKKQ
ncbi:MAG: helix-turn-helix transcriptional regulator [Afipia sp.]|nr:helix-turn-helix transcriptional regulator [Afipia sp.]